MPCSLPRWIGSVLLGSFSALPRRVSSPTALAFPYRTDGRHPRYSFRGLLELHWCYGLQICSPTFGGLGCEAPMKSVTKLHRSSAIQAYRDLLVRDFHPLVIRAARAHVLLQIGGAAEPPLWLTGQTYGSMPKIEWMNWRCATASPFANQRTCPYGLHASPRNLRSFCMHPPPNGNRGSL